jgi:hypothetical protein
VSTYLSSVPSTVLVHDTVQYMHACMIATFFSFLFPLRSASSTVHEFRVYVMESIIYQVNNIICMVYSNNIITESHSYVMRT